MAPDITAILTQSYFPDPHVDARQRLDAEIAQLEARIRSLRRARNALAPINQLQPEILVEIFSFAQRLSPHKGKASLVLSWVSQSWRELVHEASQLWSYIDFLQPEWFNVALSRSKSRLLELELNFRPEFSANRYDVVSLIPLCLGQLARMKALNITWHSDFPLPGEDGGWTTPAPVLVKLDLFDMFIPPNLFSGVCPSLRSLHLLLCKVDPPTLPKMPCLKELVIRHPRNSTPVDVMIDILYSIGPGLERLKLVGTLSLSASHPETTPALLEFVKLEHLELSETPAVITALLHRLSLPNLLTSHIIVPDWEGPMMVQAFVSSRSKSTWEIDCLTMDEDCGQTTLRIEELPVSGDNVDGFLSTTTCSTLFRIGSPNNAQTINILAYFGGTGAIVGSLTVLAPRLSSFFEFIDRQLDHIRTLVTNPEVPLDHATMSSVRNMMAFHDLIILEFEAQNNYGYQLSHEHLEVLRLWLFWRKKIGLKLETLTVSGMNVPSVKVINKLLGGIVDEVEVKDVVEVEEDELDEYDDDDEDGDGGPDSRDGGTDEDEDEVQYN